MATYPFDQSTYEQQPDQPSWGEPPTLPTEPPPAARVPPVDIIDNSDELWVYVEAPGFQPEEIHVRGDETTLLVSAERPGEVEEGRNVVLQERAKQLERTIQLPAPVNLSSAELTYEDGICKVMLPKAASERFTELTFR